MKSAQEKEAARQEVAATARNLRLALAEAFAPMIEDEKAMGFVRGLKSFASETQIGLTDVPISVCYRAMLTFARLQRKA